MDDYKAECSFRNLVLESIKNSKEYSNEIHKLSTMRTFMYIMDKYNIQNYLETQHIKEHEYNQYYKDIILKHREYLHDIFQDGFKKGHKTK